MKQVTSPSSLRCHTLVSLLAAVESTVIALVLTSWVWSWPVPLHADDRAVVTVKVSDTPVARETRMVTSFAPVVKRVAPPRLE